MMRFRLQAFLLDTSALYPMPGRSPTCRPLAPLPTGSHTEDHA